MDLLEIKTYPHEILRKKATLIKNIDDKVRDLITQMAATMYASKGIGLAANQVGVDQCIIIYDVDFADEKNKNLQVLINPEVITAEGKLNSEKEGCLSFPEFQINVERAAQVQVEGLNQEGQLIRVEAEGLAAVVLQHEIDHLNATLLIDYASSLKRGMYKRKVKKWLKTK